MVVIYNYPGLAIAFAGFGTAEGLKKIGVIPSTQALSYSLSAFSIMLVLDLALRVLLRQQAAKKADAAPGAVPKMAWKWLVQPAAGGSLFFMPAWLLAIAGFLFFTLKN